MAEKKNGAYTYPFPRPSLTVDVAVVTLEPKPQVLLIQRKADPFAGQWALPGGFVDENEALIDAARRELKEETGLELTDLEQLHAFGDKGRDPRLDGECRLSGQSRVRRIASSCKRRRRRRQVVHIRQFARTGIRPRNDLATSPSTAGRRCRMKILGSF